MCNVRMESVVVGDINWHHEETPGSTRLRIYDFQGIFIFERNLRISYIPTMA
jgi:hypothetical protein